MPEKSIMSSSDSFLEESPKSTAETVVKIFNVGYNKGTEMLGCARLSAEHSVLINSTREN